MAFEGSGLPVEGRGVFRELAEVSSGGLEGVGVVPERGAFVGDGSGGRPFVGQEVGVVLEARDRDYAVGVLVLLWDLGSLQEVDEAVVRAGPAAGRGREFAPQSAVDDVVEPDGGGGRREGSGGVDVSGDGVVLPARSVRLRRSSATRMGEMSSAFMVACGGVGSRGSSSGCWAAAGGGVL